MRRVLRLLRALAFPVRLSTDRRFASRAAFDEALAVEIDAHRPAFVVLAGFMRVLGPAFVRHFAGRLINIHPSLLPAFPGLRTHEQALAAGVRIHGATVHFVAEQVDSGGIIAQAAVPVRPDDDVADACRARARPRAPPVASGAAAGDRGARPLRRGPCRCPRRGVRRSGADDRVMRQKARPPARDRLPARPSARPHRSTPRAWCTAARDEADDARRARSLNTARIRRA